MKTTSKSSTKAARQPRRRKSGAVVQIDGFDRERLEQLEVLWEAAGCEQSEVESLFQKLFPNQTGEKLFSLWEAGYKHEEVKSLIPKLFSNQTGKKIVQIDPKRVEQLEVLAREVRGFLTALYGPGSGCTMEPWTQPMLRHLKKLGLSVRVYP